jgi:hypothetical protein
LFRHAILDRVLGEFTRDGDQIEIALNRLIVGLRERIFFVVRRIEECVCVELALVLEYLDIHELAMADLLVLFGKQDEYRLAVKVRNKVRFGDSEDSPAVPAISKRMWRVSSNPSGLGCSARSPRYFQGTDA